MKHYEINGNTYQLDDAVYDHLMDALCNVNAFKNKAARLSRDNQQLMAQISAKAEPEIAFSYGDTLNRIATALDAIAEVVKPILITKEIQ
jgi:hypothetical protein